MTDPEVGEIKRVFKPGMEELIAGVIIGSLLIAGGCPLVFFPAKFVIDSRGDLPFWAEKGGSWVTLLLGCGIGIGLLFCGVFMFWWMRWLSSLRLRLGEYGFAVSEREGTRVFLWPDIVAVRETHLYERPPILKGVAKYALPKMRSKCFIVYRKDCQQFAFDGTSFNGHTKLAKMIKEETDKHDVPWEIVEQHV
jgi:hypothetical protein